MFCYTNDYDDDLRHTVSVYLYILALVMKGICHRRLCQTNVFYEQETLQLQHKAISKPSITWHLVFVRAQANEICSYTMI